MGKRYRVLILAALVAALIVPVGYALSIDSNPKGTHARNEVIRAAAVTAVPAPVMRRPHAAEATKKSEALLSPMLDAAKLLCIGTILLGLAVAVRKAA
jgi:hypothetical protein